MKEPFLLRRRRKTHLLAGNIGHLRLNVIEIRVDERGLSLEVEELQNGTRSFGGSVFEASMHDEADPVKGLYRAP